VSAGGKSKKHGHSGEAINSGHYYYLVGFKNAPKVIHFNSTSKTPVKKNAALIP
jgi:hypothetical protein